MYNFEDRNILIVGGAGFVGSNLCKLILKYNKNTTITIIDNLLSSEKANVPDDKRVIFIEGSITCDSILQSLDDNFDYIFHLATYHGNQSSIHNPIADHENNTLTTLKLYDRIKNFKKIRKVVYSSAGCSVAKKTFDNAFETNEDAPIEINQDSPYSISKIFGEFYSVYYFKQHALPVVRARFQNVYGPGEILGAGQWRGTPATVWRNVVPVFVYKAIKKMPLPIENNGIATRDFIFVEDICKGLMLCALKGVPNEVYNLGSGIETSILELGKLINSYTQNVVEIDHLPKRSWDNSGKRFASTLKSEKELGFTAKTNIKVGLQITIEWTLNNLKLIESTINKHSAMLE